MSRILITIAISVVGSYILVVYSTNQQVIANQQIGSPLTSVYPKFRTIRAEPLQDSPIACRCPDGMHPRWAVWEEVGDSYHVLNGACGGKIKKSDVYSQDDVDSINLQQVAPEEGLWARILIASAHLKRNQWNRVIEQCNEALDISPNDLPALVLRANAKYGAGLYESALLDLSVAEEVKPDLNDIPFLRGFILFDKHRPEDALAQFAISLTKTPYRKANILYLALCCMSLGRYDEAVEDLEDQEFFEPALDIKAIRFRAELQTLRSKPNYELAIKDYELLATKYNMMKAYSSLSLSFIHSTRADIAQRKPETALKLLESDALIRQMDELAMDFHLAKCLAHMASKHIEQADGEMATLKKMYVSKLDYPEIDLIQKALQARKDYVPSHGVVLCANPPIRLPGSGQAPSRMKQLKQ